MYFLVRPTIYIILFVVFLSLLQQQKLLVVTEFSGRPFLAFATQIGGLAHSYPSPRVGNSARKIRKNHISRRKCPMKKIFVAHCVFIQCPSWKNSVSAKDIFFFEIRQNNFFKFSEKKSIGMEQCIMAKPYDLGTAKKKFIFRTTN